MGIPEEEVAFIHDAGNDKDKQALFDSVNSGKVRVLIGSTEKCGAGTNVQERLVALHHLDTPYRPSDMQQREGRIIRQGNTNKEVKVFTYVTERTFDSYSYQILENKQRFISQIDRGDPTVRESDDIDETTLSYAEIKAITAANPKIKRKMEVDTEVTRLRTLEGQYKKNLYALQDKIRKTYPESIRRQELLIEHTRQDIQMLEGKPDEEHFAINVNGHTYTDKKEGARALTDALYASSPDRVVAEYCGLKISINPLVMLLDERSITLSGTGQYTIEIGQSATGNIQRIDNFIADLPNREKRLSAKLEQLRQDLAVAEEQVKQPFEHNEKDDKVNIFLPEGFTVHLRNGKENASLDLTAQEFIKEVKSSKDYGTLERPNENSVATQGTFAKIEEQLQKIPAEMKERPNWVAVRTKTDEETGKVKKYLVDCNTGTFAKSDEPSTWTTFGEACKFAREKGCTTIAYALDGKDGICCIDLDKCFDDNNTMTPLAASVIQKTGGSYCETSISGKGYHFFGKTKGMDVRAFAKDGDMEFYQKSHFIAMTGDTSGGSQLLSFDNLPIRDIILSKCEKRSEWNGTGKGVAGLAVMSDRDVVKKAIAAKNGADFKALYEGQDLQNNHSNSDMSLMNRLAYWCNGDKEQMLRIFATSGMYRSGKSPDYYEGTAIKAIKDVNNRFPSENKAKPPIRPINSGGNGKR